MPRPVILPMRPILAFTLLLTLLAAPSAAGKQPAPPPVTAAAVYAYDLETGIVLYEQNADERMQIGSTVKVATALVAIASADTSDQVLIQESDTVDITVYSNMQLQAGDTLTLGTLLWGLLLPSGSDGALAISRHVGSILCECDNLDQARGAFVQAMNEYAAGLGLQNTRFVNESGIDSSSAYSTAHDIAIIFGEFMKSPYLAGIVSESAYSFYSAGPEARHYQSGTTNQLLGQMGVVGGKTGSTGTAGGCVVLARSMNGGSNTVITAVLGADLVYEDDVIVEGSDQRWNDARTVFSAMDEQYAWVVPGTEGTFPGLTAELAVWQVQLSGTPVIPYPRNGVETSYQLVLGNDGEEGSVRLYYDQQLVGDVPVVATSATAPEPAAEVTRHVR